MPAIPLALLGVVALMVFVGCALNVEGLGSDDNPPPPPNYRDTISKTPNLIAFWPLNEAEGETQAKDVTGNGHDGEYTPTAAVPFDPVQQSASAPGTVDLGQSGIVPGDTINNQVQPCPSFQGGYVKVPFDDALNSASFTIEAWVNPLALAPNEAAIRVVVASDAPPAFKGFALAATPDNFWNATIGDGLQNIVAAPPPSTPAITPGSTYFLVVTYDGKTLTLWVNPADTSQPPYAETVAIGFVPVAKPIPFFIGIGHPDLPTPLLPFNGAIQDVAFYSDILDKGTIQKHFETGLGMAGA
jgi:hypothetical protein